MLKLKAADVKAEEDIGIDLKLAESAIMFGRTLHGLLHEGWLVSFREVEEGGDVTLILETQDNRSVRVKIEGLT